MRIIFKALIVSFFTLLSCNQQNNAGKLYVAEVLQKAALDVFYMGAEYKMQVQEIGTDMSQPERGKKGRFILLDMEAVDSLTDIVINHIEGLKMEMFQSMGESITAGKEGSLYQSDRDKLRLSMPNKVNLGKVKYQGKTEILNQRSCDELVRFIRQFRGDVCSTIVESNRLFTKGWNPSFYDPMLDEYTDEKDFKVRLADSLEKFKVNSDDREGVKEMYRTLTKTTDEWERILQPNSHWLDDFLILTSLENDVLKVREIAFNLIRLRIGCQGEYGFSKILPLVKGPGIAAPRDTLELKVFIGAFNEWKDPEIEVFGDAKVIKVEKGIGHVRVVMPANKKEINLEGKISIKNKVGIGKTLDWSHRIVNISKN
ncbi:MAG: hypothetical protein N4A41_05055 [Crocinitomicaceae bacterium]|jgi:hypothetical protein|nr:hypothetical protein [Crocinitomicaceae bacterium]